MESIEKLAMKELNENWTEDQDCEKYADEATDGLVNVMVENKLMNPMDLDHEFAYTVLLYTWTDYF